MEVELNFSVKRRFVLVNPTDGTMIEFNSVDNGGYSLYLENSTFLIKQDGRATFGRWAYDRNHGLSVF
jgi:hypothetical protein